MHGISQNHRKFWMEGTLKIIWFQLTCHGQGHLPLDQIYQIAIMLLLKMLSCWMQRTLS